MIRISDSGGAITHRGATSPLALALQDDVTPVSFVALFPALSIWENEQGLQFDMPKAVDERQGMAIVDALIEADFDFAVCLKGDGPIFMACVVVLRSEFMAFRAIIEPAVLAVHGGGVA